MSGGERPTYESEASSPFDGLGRQQMLMYAHELWEHYRKEQDLERALQEYKRQIQTLAAASITAQEEERQWIAYEVHDRIAQTLASVFQQLQLLESLVSFDSETYRVASRASVLLRDAIRESRNIMNDLHPPVLDEFGVGPLIEEELRRFQEETKCPTKFLSSCTRRPSRNAEVALYRIFHEALINVRRHASTARCVTVTLTCNRHVLSLQVRDDGPGFDVDAAKRLRRVGGLMSMQRRAEIIGGELKVKSSPRRGTSISIRVPVDESSL